MSHTNLPVVVDAAADLSFFPNRGNESWYVTAFVSCGGHRYGLLAHHMSQGAAPEGATGSSVSITGETLDFYARNEVTLAAAAGLESGPGIDIRNAVMSWSGNASAMTLCATLPDGGFDLTLRPDGQVLYNLGSGCFNMFGEAAYLNYQYSFPKIEARGTLTLNGQTQPITGSAWFDRQWGPLPQIGREAMWIWMNLMLSNGDRISLWDTKYRSQNTWGTVFSAGGVHTIVEAAVTRRDDAPIWKSPESGMSYATRWRVAIPSLGAELDVAVTVARQELLVPGPRYEGLATIKGVYRGGPVTGRCYVETGPLPAAAARP